MKFLPVWIAFSGCSLFIGSATGQVTSTHNSYLMRLKLTNKSSYNYILTSSAEGVKLVSPLKFTYSDVKGDIADVEVVSGPSNINGVVQGQATTSKAKLNSQGKPLGKVTDALGSIAGIIFPLKPMKVGETLIQTLPVNFGGQLVKVTTIHKFLGERKVGPRKAIAFKVAISGTGSIKMEGATSSFVVNGTGSKFFDYADGHLISSNLTQTIDTKSKDHKMTTTNVVEIIRK